MKNIVVRVAIEEDGQFAKIITDEMEAAAIIRGSGISKRSPASIIKKINEGKAVIAVTNNNVWVGFSYIEVWGNGEFVSNSGLIVAPAYRGNGVAKLIKEKIFELSKSLYPGAKIFSITTGLAIMKMNAGLGFEPVTFSEVAKDKDFWMGCKSCVNHAILKSKHCKNCLCTAMLYTPAAKSKEKRTRVTGPLSSK
ncbi:MAG: GNAT family N-acetyltransferase [Ferruginibacter sp.]